MRKVTTINLNNNAFQIDEEGYESLHRYLDDASRALQGNPDREEILADLEQAIADKCRATLGQFKTVVSREEIDRILKEMGRVSGGTENSGSAGESTADAQAAGAKSSSAHGPTARRLYRVREDMKWAGVCAGLAAYAGIDVSLVRIVVIVITIVTGFFPGLIAYLAMAFILPVANTPEEMAAASGQPFNAQELVERVKKKHEEFRDERRMRREGWWSQATSPLPQPAPGYAARVTAGVLLPVLTVISAVWFAGMAIAAYSIWWVYRFGDGGAWPAGAFHFNNSIPYWVALAAVIAVFALLAIPLSAGRRAARWYANGGRRHGWADAWSGLLWLAVVAVILLAAMYQLPQLQWLLRSLTGTEVTVVL